MLVHPGVRPFDWPCVTSIRNTHFNLSLYNLQAKNVRAIFPHCIMLLNERRKEASAGKRTNALISL